MAVSAGLHFHSRGHSHCDCCCGHGPPLREKMPQQVSPPASLALFPMYQ